MLDPDPIEPDPAHSPYIMGFCQLVHLATLASIGPTAAEDIARLVAERPRVVGPGNAYTAGGIVLKAVEALQRSASRRAGLRLHHRAADPTGRARRA